MALKVRYVNPDAGNIAFDKLCEKIGNREIPDTRLIKDDATTTLVVFDAGNGPLVFKQYNTKNFWHLVRRNFQTSRAANCLKMARLFEQAGLAVAEPIAVVESVWGPFTGRSWYVSRYVDNEVLLDYLGGEQDEEVITAIVDKVVRTFEVFLNTGMSHGDMKATNILVRDGELVLIDLDASRKHGSGFLHARAISRDCRRFLKNWHTSPELLQRFSGKFAKMGISQ